MDTKKDNFVRVSEKRLNKIIDQISSFSNFDNTSFYEYTDEEINEIFDKIDNESSKQRKRLLDANHKIRKIRL